MKLQDLLTEMLALEAQDSGIDSASFKLGYLLPFVSSYKSMRDLREAAQRRITHLRGKLAGKETA